MALQLEAYLCGDPGVQLESFAARILHSAYIVRRDRADGIIPQAHSRRGCGAYSASHFTGCFVSEVKPTTAVTYAPVSRLAFQKPNPVLKTRALAIHSN